MYYIVLLLTLSLFCQTIKTKIFVMKKFIFIANFIVLLVLVPAVMIGYLHNNSVEKDSSEKTMLVKDTDNGQPEAISVFFVKTF